jgi:tRNA pseudouridine-54 N-methylase
MRTVQELLFMSQQWRFDVNVKAVLLILGFRNKIICLSGFLQLQG